VSELKNQVEAILFASGKKVTYEELARLCNTEISNVKAEVLELKKSYESRDSPIILTEESDGWKMTVREKYLSVVHKMLPETELSKSVLETLAVIAWKQPVLQSDVIKIRTNKAYDDIQELVERGFISKEKSGRSYLIKVTNKFREYFELPSKEAIKKIFKDIQEHLKQEEAKENGKDRLGKLEVYEEERAFEERPQIKIYDHKIEEREPEEDEEEAEKGPGVAEETEEPEEDNDKSAGEESGEEPEKKEPEEKYPLAAGKEKNDIEELEKEKSRLELKDARFEEEGKEEKKDSDETMEAGTEKETGKSKNEKEKTDERVLSSELEEFVNPKEKEGEE